jgi:hypothetical protein
MGNRLIIFYFTIQSIGGSLYFCAPAYAYQDLGSGSYFIQIILAALFGGFFFLKQYWKKVKNFLARLLNRKEDPNDGNQ